MLFCKMASLEVGAPVVAKVADFGLTTPLYIKEFRSRFVDQPLWFVHNQSFDTNLISIKACT